jgi:hypothetical protein
VLQAKLRKRKERFQLKVKIKRSCFYNLMIRTIRKILPISRTKFPQNLNPLKLIKIKLKHKMKFKNILTRLWKQGQNDSISCIINLIFNQVQIKPNSSKENHHPRRTQRKKLCFNFPNFDLIFSLMMSSFRTQKTQSVVLILKRSRNHKFVKKTTSRKMMNKILKLNQSDQSQPQ